MICGESRGYTKGTSTACFDSPEFVDLKDLYACSFEQGQNLEQMFFSQLNDVAEMFDDLHHDLAVLPAPFWANRDHFDAAKFEPPCVCFGAERVRLHEDPTIIMESLAGTVEPLLLCPPGLDLPFDSSLPVTIIDSDDDTTSASSNEQALHEDCRWHESSHSVGVVSGNGHIFTNTAGADKIGRGRQGETLKLGSLCMVFDRNFRRGGQHQYNYAILDGNLGAADGAGFVFDSKIRRSNIQRMRSVFLNRRGQLCVRDQQRVTRLGARLPEFWPGVMVVLIVDLDNLWLHFTVYHPDGSIGGTADVSAAGLFGDYVPDAGFFCAVVTKDVTVALT